MAEIIPFAGYRYNPLVVGDVAKLIAPPYDVIDLPLRDALYRLSEYNIARLIRAERDETRPGEPYHAAGKLLAQWQQDRVMLRDPEPALYVYEQFFEVHERKFSRTGLVALARLEELGTGVLPHENTHTGPRRDRLDLLRATRTQFGQIFGLYSDPEARIDAIVDAQKERRPDVHAADTWGQLHRLWVVTEPGIVAELQGLMRDKQVLIADGHHRYETALAYAREHPDLEGAQYRMMTLVNMSNIGLVVLPIHRLLKGLTAFDPADFRAGLRKVFKINTYPGDSSAVRSAVTDSMRARQEKGLHAFGLFVNDGNYYELVLKREELMDEIQGRSEVWRHIDVAMLHHIVFDRILGLTPDRMKEQTNVDYVPGFPHAIDEAIKGVASGECQALFLLNPARVEEVRSIARSGERMPQKSTFFYPKVFTGLVFHQID